MLLLIGALILGLALLTKAADEFVVGAARLAITLRISAVVVGALVIGFGTSTPELLVSVLAAGQDSVDIAIGNVIGSNVANLTLVLGIAALITPFTVASVTLRREAPIATGAVLMFAILLQQGLGRGEGSALAVALVLAVTWIIFTAKRTDGDPLTSEVEEFVETTATHPLGREITRTLLGMAGTLLGAQMLVYGARGIAREMGLAEGFVGLSVVAVGTSLPELVTAIQAARRREQDLVIGNLLGSNMFNSLAVAGSAALVRPGIPDPTLAGAATVVMVGVAVATWVFMITGRRVQRWEGALLLAAYPLTLALAAG